MRSANETHESLTDPAARLYKKTRSAEARLRYRGHVATENRHGLVVDVRSTLATGTADREGALKMLDNKPAGKSRSPEIAATIPEALWRPAV